METPDSLSEALAEALQNLLSMGRVEVRENQAWLSDLEGFRFEIRRQKDAVLLHLWSQQSSAVRRVARIAETQTGRLLLEVSRLGRAKNGHLEFVVPESTPRPGRVARAQFASRFREILTQQFPDEKILSITSAPDLEHSLSGNYTRALTTSRVAAWAVMGAAPRESAASYDAQLTFGLLWLHRARNSTLRQPVAGLRLFFPEGTSRVAAHRLQGLSSSTLVELYEYNPDSERSRRLDPRDAGNIATWLLPRREIEAIMAQARSAIDPICLLSPVAIRAEVIPGTRDVALRFRGLLFAKWQDGQILYGLGDPRAPLTSGSMDDFQRLVAELELHRSPLATARQHPLYRAQPERWLERMVAADPGRVDARLNPDFLYAQVPAFSAGDRGVMDLVGVTRSGRLAVIEIKATEDIQLVAQAMDYWLRVRWHHSQQEFPLYGYFHEIALDPRPPLLFLVAPSLRFHPACSILLEYLHPTISVQKVGFSESWRRGLKVVLRQELQ